VTTRVVGYVLIPLPLWKLLFPQDSLLDMGFRLRGFFRHIWIYGLCLAVVLPAMLLVATQPDFGTYYPFYKHSSRSWFDFLAWELIYFIQFYARNRFFRGWIVGALRKSLGSAAISRWQCRTANPLRQALPERTAQSLPGWCSAAAMRTRSIYSGFPPHNGCLLVDLLAPGGVTRSDALWTRVDRRRLGLSAPGVKCCEAGAARYLSAEAGLRFERTRSGGRSAATRRHR
jgi:hypothetical protein